MNSGIENRAKRKEQREKRKEEREKVNAIAFSAYKQICLHLNYEYLFREI